MKKNKQSYSNFSGFMVTNYEEEIRKKFWINNICEDSNIFTGVTYDRIYKESIFKCYFFQNCSKIIQQVRDGGNRHIIIYTFPLNILVNEATKKVNGIWEEAPLGILTYSSGDIILAQNLISEHPTNSVMPDNITNYLVL